MRRKITMYKLLYTPNVPFDMSDWEKKKITKVFAGMNCVMAITETGETLQKIRDTELMARTQFWKRVRQISISKWAEGAAIGLIEDGTCMISKRPIRRLCKKFNLDFEHINNTVKSWTDVVQVEASDAFFALCADGTVRCVSFCERNSAEYQDVACWRDVVRIVTGVQNSVFGITKSGKILVAGYNAMHAKTKPSNYNDIIDLYPTGVECPSLHVLNTEGRILDECDQSSPSKLLKLDGHFNHELFALTDSGQVVDLSGNSTKSVFPDGYRIVSFAVGDWNYQNSFIIAVAEK